MNQRDLVERAKGGDHDAFEALAGPQVSRLDAAARLILRDPDLARDAVQDGFIRAWRNLPALRDPDRFDAWIRRLVVNSCLDIARRRRRRAIEVELSPLDALRGVDVAVSVVDRDVLDGALRLLEPEWRAIVVMHYYLGMPLPDVAAALGIPLGTAKSRLHRAIGLMRMNLDSGDAQATGQVPAGRPV
ncbi:MAG: RNA polymerase sigma factor [Chloroflexota bacterium]